MVKPEFLGGGGNYRPGSTHVTGRALAVNVIYIAVQNNPLFVHYASQFVDTYKKYPGGRNHRLIICCNGGKLGPKMKPLFDGIACEFVERQNDDGWDVSAYQDMAQERQCDLQVCFGESVRFHRSGWLERLVESADEFGEGMYGCLSSHAVSAHLNTTAFAVTPKFLKEYPKVLNRTARYQFEHGQDAMWRRIHAQGAETRLVTWDGCWEPGQWRTPPNILWRGDQSNCLVFANHTDRWFGRHEPHRRQWSEMADMPFK